MNLGICKLCDNPKELIEAHIIPESLYPPDKKGNRMQYVLDGEGKLPRSKLLKGDFDRNLVCRACEDLFQEGDDYAKRLLIDQRGKVERKEDKGTTYFEYEDVDYKRLKLFFVSLIWRAHATSLRNFKQVDLGPKYASISKRMIREGDPGQPNDFAVVMLRAAEGPLSIMGASPTPRKIPPNGARAYEILLFGYLVYIKVDQRSFGSALEAVQLAPGKPLLMLEKPIDETPFYRFAKEAHAMAEATKMRLRDLRKQ